MPGFSARRSSNRRFPMQQLISGGLLFALCAAPEFALAFDGHEAVLVETALPDSPGAIRSKEVRLAMAQDPTVQDPTVQDPTVQAPTAPDSTTQNPDVPDPSSPDSRTEIPAAQSPSPNTTAPAIPSQPSTQKPPQEPLGTAAAELGAASGTAASKPAGVAVAPAKQHRSRSLLFKVGAIVGAGAALGTVFALSASTSSKPPGAR